MDSRETERDLRYTAADIGCDGRKDARQFSSEHTDHSLSLGSATLQKAPRTHLDSTLLFLACKEANWQTSNYGFPEICLFSSTHGIA